MIEFVDVMGQVFWKIGTSPIGWAVAVWGAICLGFWKAWGNLG